MVHVKAPFMGGHIAPISFRQRLTAGLVAGLLLCMIVVLLFAASWPIFAAAATLAIGALCFLKIASENTSWTKLAVRLEHLADSNATGDPELRIARAVAALEQAVALRDDRLASRHPVTGLPTREPLLVRMKDDADGTLGVLSFPDFDRLCAFDPASAERLLSEIVARLRTMMPAERMLAQVDRAHVAIWFGSDIDEKAAQSELTAIEYALGSAVKIAERSILPEVKCRVVAVSGEEPDIVLARTLSLLAVDAVAGTPRQSDLTATGDGLDARFTLEQDLRHAILRGQLQMAYQPLVDAARNRICGAEALMRWRHHERGVVTPAEFFPVVEACGLSHEFGLWAINTACRDAQQCLAEGLGNIRIAVNVSARQLERTDLSALIERTLTRHSLSADAIEIELTETAAMVDCDRIAQLFSRLRAMGVQIAIDDFGTGYSSLSTLRKLSFDKIKIDREFVTEVEHRRDSQAICQSLIALARGLNIAVLAEGVEREEEYAWLLRHGCNYFQGYFFSRPIDFPDFVALCRDPLAIASKTRSGPASLQKKISERLSA
jgi:EAL domain-containing protein (putative c-di-GMP-specific phosphodiesterase class I)/GGDEF domain-containing protein